MNNENYEAKEIVLKIIEEERERRERVQKLEQELKELEEQGEMCDTKKMIEIIDELNIINPKSESENNTGGIKKPNKKGKFIILKISAACVAVVISTQILVSAAFDINILNSVYDWTKEFFLSLVGIEIQQDNIDIAVSASKVYNTVEEFETAENVKILIPKLIPNDLKVEYLTYSEELEYKRLRIWYDDNYSSVIIKFGVNYINYDAHDNYEIRNNNEIDFYIFKDSKTIQWVYENNNYTLTCDFNEHEILKIIYNIK